MKSPFYYNGHHIEVGKRIKEHLNSYIDSTPDFLSAKTAQSTRAVGDAIESIISDNFDGILQNYCVEYSSDFARRSMADLAFTDQDGFYSIVDVKTHRKGTVFNMPNLTSVKRLARFYESDQNIFSLLIIKYSIEDTFMNVIDVMFIPIEFLSWECLTIGALGWGQIQIANSNNININDGYSRKKWMLQFCDNLSSFYPNEILKIKDRIDYFTKVKKYWENKEDIWI